MALQVLLRNSLLVAAMLVLLQSCSNKQAVYVQDTGSNFITKGGITNMNGKAFTGIRYHTSPGGDTTMLCSYHKGKEDGTSKEWWAKGILKEDRFYQQGYKEKEHRGWYGNGQLKFVYHYHKDVYEGNQKEWMETGQLYRDCNYKKGQEDGMQRMYWPDGKIRMNYQYVNGRKYGLTGVKNCVPAGADSTGSVPAAIVQQ